MTLELKEIQRRLEDRNLAKVAKRIGVTYKTIWKVANIAPEEYERVSYKTLMKISEYLEGHL